MSKQEVRLTEAVAPRPKRECDVCFGFDDAPRHVVGLSGEEPIKITEEQMAIFRSNVDLNTNEGANALSSLIDRTTQYRHMDCCRSVGCPDGSCYRVTAGAEDLRNDELVAHLTKGA